MWKIPSNRATRITRRGLRICAAAALVWVLLQQLLLPPLVRRAARQALAGIGLENTQFTVRGVSMVRTELEELQFAPGKPSSIQAIAVEYSPFTLIFGRVHSIRLTGAQIELAWRDGAIDLEALGLKLKPSGGGPVKLPLERIELKASALHVSWAGGDVVVPVAGGIEQTDSGLAFDLRATVQSAPISISGMFAPEENKVQLHLACENAEVASLLALAPRGVLPGLAAGRISLAADYQQSSAGRHTTVRVSGEKLLASGEFGGRRVLAEDAGFSVNAELGARFELAELKGKLDARLAAVDDLEIRRFSMDFRKSGDDLVASASFKGESFECERLKTTVSGSLAPKAGGVRVQTEFGFSGYLPRAILNAASARDIDLDRMGRATVGGTVVFDLGGDSWSAQATSVTIGVAPGVVELPGTTLQGARANLELAGSADPYAVTLSVRPGSSVSADDLRGIAGVKWTKQAPEPLVSARVGAEPATVSVSLSSAGWQVAAPRLGIETTTLDATAEPGLSAKGMALRGEYSLQAGPAEVQLSPLAGAGVVLGTATFTNEAATAAAEEISAQLDGPMVYRPTSGLTAKGVLGSAKTVKVKGADFSAEAASIKGNAELNWPIGRAMSLGGSVVLSPVGFSQAASGIAVKDASLSIPFAIAAPDVRPGAFSLPQITLNGKALPAVSGTLLFSDGKVAATASVAPIKGSEVRATATLDLTRAPMTADITATLPKFRLADKSAIAEIAPALKGYDITGEFSGGAELRLRNGRLIGSANLDIENARLESQANQWTFDGVSGSVTLDGFSPAKTRPGQSLKVKSARMGKVALSNGVCTFRLDSPDEIHIEELAFDFAGGRLFTNSVSFDRRTARLSAMLTADRVKMEQFVPLMLETATGTGSLYGRLPVEVRWPQQKRGDARSVKWTEPQIAFGEGFLYATPDGGHLKIVEAAKFIDQTVAEQDPRLRQGGAMQDVREKLVRALGDLQYNVLRLDFVREQAEGEDHLLARVFVSGKGAGQDGPEIGGFTVNIRPFDELLKRGIGYGTKVTGFGQ